MKALLIILVAVLAGTSAYFGIAAFVSSRWSVASQQTWAAMEAVPLACPEGTEPRTDGWGKAGYSRICIPPKDGLWEAWEDGYRQISGKYERGRQNGRWTFFNRDGSVSHTVEYQNGVEVNDASN